MNITEFFNNNEDANIVMEDIRSIGHIAPSTPESFMAKLRGNLNIPEPQLATTADVVKKTR